MTDICSSADSVSTIIKSRWACPKCRSSDLREEDGGIRCGRCASSFGVHRGIPLFLGRDVASTAAAVNVDLTILMSALNESENLRVLMTQVQDVLREIEIRYEILVVDGGSSDDTVEVARARGARVIMQKRPGYGSALTEGFQAACGKRIMTMDADLSHPALYVERLWRARDQSDLVIASRFLEGARFDGPLLRRLLSRILNFVFRHGLSIPVRDMSSGLRLYLADCLKDVVIRGVNFEALEELLLGVYMDGWSVSEIPFHYAQRDRGRSKARLLSFGVCLLRSFFMLWRLRSSIAAADYDERGFSSRIPLQRYWHRRRHGIVVGWLRNHIGATLDVGCGSSRILHDLPLAIGLDVSLSKLRYLRQRHATVVQGSVFDLPFQDASFENVVCSQVLEHVPQDETAFRELGRVIRPGGLLVAGTPDYGRPYWPFIEGLYKRVHPHGYADEHITHYDRRGLDQQLERAGFEPLRHAYILGAELIVLARRV
ncbi:MAG: methyltransferase domain-containing protein [Vicinamibacteria bacterium]|nr:methyltransferase domain-containing protein [Vicinamibacteria bacterium]